MHYWLAAVLSCSHVIYFSAGRYIYDIPASREVESRVARSKPLAFPETTYALFSKMKDLQSCVLKHWVHSHEEDGQDIMVYRPASYNFPPSRGRSGFEFQEGGKLVYYGIGRGDGADSSSGHWLIEAPNRIRVSVDNARIQPFVLDVISCDDQLLKVKK